MSKKTKGIIIRTCITLPLFLLFTWYCFTYIYVYPKIELWRNGNRSNTTLIKIEENYEFAEDPYTIENTDTGYDIIIHMKQK